jgi:hypothetical protein
MDTAIAIAAEEVIFAIDCVDAEVPGVETSSHPDIES